MAADPAQVLRELAEAAEAALATPRSLYGPRQIELAKAAEAARSTLEAVEGGERKQPRISITYDRASSMYVIGDEDGEFARVGAWNQTWHYVIDLLTGPGTLSAGSLFDRTVNPELQGTVARLPDNQGAEDGC